MSNFGDHPAGFFGVSDFYNGVATQSLRFEDGSAHKLTRTFSGDPDNNKKMTISVWVKRGNLATGGTQVILANYDGTRFLGELAWDSSTDVLRFDPGGNGDGSSNSYRIDTTALFRDVSSWYHIVVAYDSTQGTDTNRVKIYVNGTQKLITVPSGQSYPPQNYAHLYSYQGANNTIGEFGANFDSGELDGYLSEFNFIDGLALAPTSFGETKNGVWIAKKYTGSYGSNGYRLEFKNTSVGTGSSSTIGADTSGNNNHWTSSGTAAHDCAMPDSPENNFCTYNPLDAKGNDNTFSEGNLKVVVAAQNTDEQTTATFAVSSGKWYWEHRLNSTTTSDAGYFKIGLRDITHANAWTVRGTDGETQDAAGTTATASVSYTTGNVIGVYLDMDNAKWYVSVDGTLQNSANLTNGTGFLHNNLTGTIHPFILNASSGGTHTGMGNFGQDSTFAGLESAGGYSDANGNGDFHSAVTSPYLALCSANLPEPTIGPNSDTQATDYFNTVLYSGNSSSNAISGVGFQPDWVWTKCLSAVRTHSWMDSQRGFAGNGNSLTLATSGNSSNGEFENGGFDSFDSDGFTVSGSDEFMNESGDSYVAWNWKVNGGTATATASEDGNNPAYSVQANPTAGISIATYTGTNGVGTIPHGLGAVPRWAVFKNRNVDGNDWIVYHGANTSAPETDFLRLNTTALTADNANRFNDTAPTSSVFTLGADGNINDNGESIVAYFFANVEGYSKFDSYIANGISGDGPFVFTGFRPAMIIVKNTSNNTNGGEWVILDDTRLGVGTTNTINPIKSYIEVNESNAEFDSTSYPLVDFYSNGFKIRSDAANSGVGRATNNANGNVYVYMAWAHSPFKYANAF